MSQANAFLRAILDEPEDDTHRLVHADWLDEHGDSQRAAFIRAQIELDRGVEDADRRRDLRRRIEELLKAHERAWRANLPLLPGIGWGGFRRGFVEEASAKSFKAFDARALGIRAAIPLLELDLTL